MATEVEVAAKEDGLRCADGRRLSGDLARVGSIFCGGPLLAAVQTARLFKDGKHFVDMPLKEDPETVLAEFQKLADKADKKALADFVSRFFEASGADLEEWTPPDCQESPPFLALVQPERRDWASAMNRFWAKLGRRQRAGYLQHRCSFLIQPHPTIVPGGRFLESYYWDSYWVIRGLLVCGMIETAKGIVENFLDSVARVGFIPNGSRVYYLDRSQPPLLTDMALAIFDVTEDKDWLSQVLPTLVDEYSFWMRDGSAHVVVTASGKLNVYRSAREGPRPESYLEDLETARAARGRGLEPVEAYRGLCAGAESGWDFSTRWLDDSDESLLPQARLETMKTHKIVPVDLNCFLLKVEEGLARAHEILAKSAEAQAHRKAAFDRRAAIEAVLWDDAAKCYFDYHLDAGRSSKVIALSNWAAPLWAGLRQEDNFIKSLEQSGLLQPGGSATTAVDTAGATQWDAPNAWPPLQHMLIEGLEPIASGLAQQLAESWLQSCHAAWEKSGFMYEKYNAMKPGEGGGGGEYEPQVGFGWSNGVALVLLTKQWPPEGSEKPVHIEPGKASH